MVEIRLKPAPHDTRHDPERWHAPRPNPDINFSRPSLSGWWYEPDCVLPKPVPLIIALDRHATLTALDLVVWNLLIASAWADIAGPGQAHFRCQIADLNAARGVRSRGNRDLKTALQRLHTVPLEYPLLATTNDGCPVVTSPLMRWQLVAGDRELEWLPSPPLLAALQTVPVYGKIKPRTEVALNSRAAILLYELLCSRAAMQQRTYALTLGQLHALLGTAEKYPRWAALRRQVLEPALARVESHTGWTIRIDVAHAPRRPQRVTQVRLTLAGGSRRPV